MGEKIANGGEQRLRLFDVRHVSGVLDHDEPRAHCSGGSLGRRERNWILPTVDDQRGNGDRIELAGGEQIVVAKAFPYRLLNAAGDTKWRQIVRRGGIGEISCDAELERALPIRVRIALAKTGAGQVGPQLSDGRVGLPT